MANYSYILNINEDGRDSTTVVELRLSDSYTDLIDAGTTFDTVTNVNLGTLTQNIEGDTLNVFAERLQLELIGAMQNESTANSELVEFFIKGVNGVPSSSPPYELEPYPIFCRLLLNNEDMFTGGFDKYTFGYNMVKDNQTDFLHAFEKNNYKMEFEQTGSNILKEILNDDILTDGAGSFLERIEAIPGMVEAKQGSYSYSGLGNILNTQKLIMFGDFLTELLVELKTYINNSSDYDIIINTTELNADNSGIGSATGVGTGMVATQSSNQLEPFAFKKDNSDNIIGEYLKKVMLWNNAQGLYAYNSVNDKNNIFITVSSIFDNVEEAGEGIAAIDSLFLNDHGEIYKIKHSTKSIFEMLTLLMYNLSLNFEIRIDDNNLSLNISNLDAIADAQVAIYTGLLDSFEEKIKDESESETTDEDLEYVSINNVYAFPNEKFNPASSQISLKAKPLPLSIMPAYFVGAFREIYGYGVTYNYAMQTGHTYLKPMGTDSYSRCPNTCMYMKIVDYNTAANPATSVDLENGFATYRPEEFFAPIGRLAYKVNDGSYDSFDNIEDRITYFQKRFNGRDEGNLKKEATASIASISDFSLSSAGSATSPHNLQCGNNIFLNNEKYFITSVERDFKGVSTKLNLIADGFFAIDTPVIDETDDKKIFFPPPVDAGDTEIIIGIGDPAESIVSLDIVAFTDTGLITNFTNSADYYNEIAGIALSITTSGTTKYVDIQNAGRMTNDSWSWTVDAVLYARYNATTEKMELSEIEPTTADGDMIIVMGRAINATTINIKIENYLFE